MADVVAAPASTGSWLHRLIAFYHAVVAEMRRVTWPETADVRRATVAIIIFVLLLGLVIYLLDVTLQGLLANLIPKLFAGR